jgi:hypothetical protein
VGLKNLFGKSDKHAEMAAPQSVTCLHTTMTPRWDRAEDIGKHDLATSYRCEGCGEVFAREQVDQLRASELERVRSAIPT